VDQRARVAAAGRALLRAAPRSPLRARARLAAAAARLDSLSPLGVLARGYALVRRKRDGAIVRGPGEVAAGDAVAVRVAEAELEARVTGVRPLPPRSASN
jgi:exodeoxyribonuclease VII large subunit